MCFPIVSLGFLDSFRFQLYMFGSNMGLYIATDAEATLFTRRSHCSVAGANPCLGCIHMFQGTISHILLYAGLLLS